MRHPISVTATLVRKRTIGLESKPLLLESKGDTVSGNLIELEKQAYPVYLKAQVISFCSYHVVQTTPRFQVNAFFIGNFFSPFISWISIHYPGEGTEVVADIEAAGHRVTMK